MNRDRALAPRAINGKAKLAFALSIIGLVLSVALVGLVASVLAIIFARIANRTIAKTGERGKGLALAAIIVGLVGLAVATALIVVVAVQGK